VRIVYAIAAGAIVGAIVGAAVGGTVAGAQQPGFSRTTIQQGDLSTAGREVVQAIAAFEPGATVGWHTHPGEEAGYLLEGSFLFEFDGKPSVNLKAGGTFFVPAGKVHNATNHGTGRTRVLATYIVDKGKPLATAVLRK
jgi:quercetin dioxygenase-like cupin family protein